ncbi:MAG: apolipoprotein N-acyltransferase, partial [Terriglobia bacterium]
MALPLSPLRHATACALLSGLLLVLSFPHAHLDLLAWVALAPLLAALVYRRSRRRNFFLGYLTGVVFLAGTCPWIYHVMRHFGHLGAAAAAGVLAAFVLGLAVHFGLFSLAVGELARRWQVRALWAAPLAWVAMEWLRAWVPFGGFPWNLLGYAVAPRVGWIQPAAYAGIYGVSFLLAGVSALVAWCWLAPSRRRAAALAAVAVVLTLAELGAQGLPPAPVSERVLLVQANLPQQEEFDPRWLEHHADVLADLEQRTREAAVEHAAGRPALILWPEVPVSIYFNHDPVLRARLLQLAQATRSNLLVGIVDYRPGEGGKLHPRNSAVLLSPAGSLLGQYDKIHLVPFGEYVPWPGGRGFLGRLVEEVSDFRPGEDFTLMPAEQGPLAVFICFEAVFPSLVREFAGRGARVLVNISNDGWYGSSAAGAQHLNMARVRAVETRRFLLRATNTGITAVVDPLGRIAARAPRDTRTVLVAGYAPREGASFYVRYGDWLPAVCALASAALVGRKLWM